MDKEDIIRKIETLNAFQQSKMVRPLTCGKNNNHRVLKAIEKDGKVILICEDCDYKEKHTPL
jgi:hypothetical protein